MQRKMWSGLGAAVVLAVVLAAVWAWSAPVPAHAQSTLSKPTNVNVSTTRGSLDVTVSWNRVDAAANYRVRVRAAGAGTTFGDAVTVQQPSGNASPEVEITVDDYGRWIVRVEACTTGGSCGTGQAKNFEVEPPLPGEPANLSVTTTTGSLQVSVNWDDVDGATSYAVRWRVHGAGIEFEDEDMATVTESEASITVGEYGSWIVQVRGCNVDNECGVRAASKRFEVAGDPNAPALPAVDDLLLAKYSFINAFALPEATGGTSPYTYALNGLPEGLQFNPSTRVLSGTPYAEQDATTYTYTVTDASGVSSSAAFTITVEPWMYLDWDWASGGGVTGYHPWNHCVREGNTTRAHMIRLEAQPSDDVTVEFVNLHQGVGDYYGGLITVNPTTMTFTSANWNVYQEMRFTMPQDDDGQDANTMFEAVVRSADHRFNFSTHDLDVCTFDDDETKLEFSTRNLSITEAGSATYTIRPATKPIGKVRVAIAVASESNADASVSPAVLADFTHQNWTTAQTVTVSLADDSNAIDGSAVISHEVVVVTVNTAQNRNIIQSDIDYLFRSYPNVNVAEDDTQAPSSTEPPEPTQDEPPQPEPPQPETDTAPTVSDTAQFRNHDATVGEAFSLTLPAADPGSGNGGPYEYRLWHRGQNRNFMDQAINGLRFDMATRTLSGTPQKSGVLLLSYVVHDGDDNRDVEDRFRARTNLQVTVTSDNPRLRIRGGSVPNFTVGTAIDPPHQLAAATGGAGGYTYSLSRDGHSLPAGVTFNPADRTLSGTPEQATERYWLWYQATDEDGDTHRERLSLGVE